MNIVCEQCSLVSPIAVIVCETMILCPRCADELERELVEQEEVE